MSTQVQIRRGNTTQTGAFTGVVAEITVDTDKKTLVVHDGTTSGGFPLALESSLTSNATFSQAAFTQANAAFLQANTPSHTANSASSYANSAYIQANTATTNASVADEKAVSAGSYANSAFTSANASIAVNTTQNNSITAAFLQANTPSHVANSAAIYANGAFTAANAATATDATQNNSITASFNTANAAFIAANAATATDATQNNNISSAASYANSAFLQANTPSHVANSAASYANSGFTQANSNYTSAVTKLDVTNSGASAYLIDQYTGNNPSIYVSGGETIAFNLNVSGHPFVIRESSGGANTSNGLIHVSTTGVVSTGASAQGYVTGVLYWKVPFSLVGSTYVYQCTIHGGMVGNIVIQQPASFVAANTTLAFDTANSAASYANSSFEKANNEAGVNTTQNTNILSAASYANSAFLSANTPSAVANSAASYANAAFTRANNSINANTGGVITGDISITGNLTVTGLTTYTNTSTVLIADNIITVNAAIGQSAQPAVNAGIEVDRGAQPNSSFLWIETSGKWAANNGNTEIFVASEATLTSAFIAANTPSHVANSAASYANSAFLRANTPSHTANSAGSYANSAFIVANNSLGIDLTQNTNITNAGTYANSAFAKANTAFDHANVVFAFANTISGGAAIDNTARSLANSASIYANGAFAAANTDVTNITISPSQTYGNASHYPVITVSANGRINAISTQVVTDPSAIAFAIALG